MKPHIFHKNRRWYVRTGRRDFGGMSPRHAWHWYVTATARPTFWQRLISRLRSDKPAARGLFVA